jgi:hypothetical protein
MDIIETIKEQIANNTILLYMKGSPNAPQCGFSAKAAQAVMGVAKVRLRGHPAEPGNPRQPAKIRQLADLPATVGGR